MLLLISSLCCSSCESRLEQHNKNLWPLRVLALFYCISGASPGIWSEACSASSFTRSHSSTPVSSFHNHRSGSEFGQQQSRPKSIQTNLTWQKDGIEPVLYSSASNMQLLIGALSEKWITMRALVQLGHVTVPFPARARHRTRRLNHGKSNTCWISEIGEWRFLDSGAGRFEREFGTGKFQNKKCSAILVKSQWIFSSKKSPQRICKDLHQFISLFEEPKVKAHGSCRNLCKYPRFLVYMSAETKQMHLFF